MEEPPSKPRRKSKLDATIKSKAAPFLPVSKPTPKRSLPPAFEAEFPLKPSKKPRHATVEGQRFIVAKRAALSREWAGSSLPLPPSSSSSNATSKKKKKKKKGKKGKVKVTDKPPSTSDKLSDDNSTDRLRREAYAYLQLWKECRGAWKFEKKKQVYLLKHALGVDATIWPTLLEYVGSLGGGGSRDKTRDEMNAVMAGFEARFGNGGSTNSVFNRPGLPTATEAQKEEYDRARQILQMLTD